MGITGRGVYAAYHFGLQTIQGRTRSDGPRESQLLFSAPDEARRTGLWAPTPHPFCRVLRRMP
jgi:hypothetical protein